MCKKIGENSLYTMYLIIEWLIWNTGIDSRKLERITGYSEKEQNCILKLGSNNHD